MKINENDFLWKCYTHLYKPEPVPHPKNLCCFFWKSMGGLIKWMAVDFSLILLLVLGSIYVYLLYNIVNLLESTTAMVLIGCCLILPVGMFVVFSCVIRFSMWLADFFGKRVAPYLPEKLKKILTSIALGIAGTVCCAMIVAAIVGVILCFIKWFNGTATRDEMHMIYLFIGLLCLIPAFLIVYAIFHPLSMTNGFKTFLAFLKAKKDRVCPLIEPPQSWEGHVALASDATLNCTKDKS